jgi:hypothetical protein
VCWWWWWGRGGLSVGAHFFNYINAGMRTSHVRLRKSTPTRHRNAHQRAKKSMDYNFIKDVNAKHLISIQTDLIDKSLKSNHTHN